MQIIYPPILYKYLGTSRISFFDQPQIRFTPLNEHDDIFEGMISFKNIAPRDKIHKWAPILLQEISSLHGGQSINDALTLLARDQDALYEHFQKSKDRFAKAYFETFLEKGIGSLCLTEDIINPKMWGLYADKSRGFAIGFDSSHAFFSKAWWPNSTFFYMLPVKYGASHEHPYVFDENAILQGFDCIWTKGAEWAEQKEWRVSIDGLENVGSTNKKGVVPVPVEAIKQVILGGRADSVLILKAKKFCQGNKLVLKKIYPDNKAYALKLEDIDTS